jgi:hypothetical protein
MSHNRSVVTTLPQAIRADFKRPHFWCFVAVQLVLLALMWNFFSTEVFWIDTSMQLGTLMVYFPFRIVFFIRPRLRDWREYLQEEALQDAYLARAREHIFELAELPNLPKGKLWGTGTLRSVLNALPDLSKVKQETDIVTLKIVPTGIDMSPVSWQISRQDLYRGSLAGTIPSVVFPNATVDDDGRIWSYGHVAVLYGVPLPELPEWKTELTRALESPYNWQVPKAYDV